MLWIWLGTLFTLWIPILPAILGRLDVTLAWDFVYVVDYNFACCFGTFRHDFVLLLFFFYVVESDFACHLGICHCHFGLGLVYILDYDFACCFSGLTPSSGYH